MKIVMVGTGYVGLVSGLCFAEFGYETVCIDKNQSRLKSIREGKSPFYEPGLDDLLDKHINSTKRLTLSSDLAKEVKKANVIFITVGTPSRRLEDEADLSSIIDVAREIAVNISNYSVIVTKSTVPVGTTRKIKEIILEQISQDQFDVVANPEFLREGSAINDFMRPDRVVIGTDSKKSEQIIKEIYRPLYLLDTPIVSTSIETAEIIKYASNSFLATKISFINEIADLCEVAGANVKDVAKAMGLDKRIGSKFLHTGPGFGGSCFPKDVKAFSATAKKLGIDLSILNAVNLFNRARPVKISSKILKYYNDDLKNVTLTILGLSFKPNTDDIRDSTSLIIAQELLKKGIKIKVYDPKAMLNAKKEIRELEFCDNAYEACEQSNGLIIATEWNEFRALNLKKIKSLLVKPVIFDLRNIY
ncbi:MAG TPA: UDP-glucose/GDP-mannose dehydrogenase family protein, partial [Pelagibacterales bacterium]|nr:UDP-glucose/GDP-mannose dehydrogenase family protein [Pelagibacterales bacterium]